MSFSDGWRVRDVADDFVQRRLAAVTKTVQGVKLQPPPPPKLSTRFDVDTSQSRLQRDKAVLVRECFDAAAAVVLQTAFAGDPDTAMQIDTIDNTTTKQLLPPLQQIADTEVLEEMRVFSMERAVDNKDLGKRKIVYQRELELRKKQEPPKPPPPPAPVPEKVNSNPPPIVAKDPAQKAAAATAATAPPKDASVTPDVPKSNAGAAVSNTTAAVAAEAPKSSSEAAKKEDASGVPKSSRNTSASSSTAVEARATMSRAILCVTANVVFDALTPALPDHPIDVTNLPQCLIDSVNADANAKPDKEKTSDGDDDDKNVTNGGNSEAKDGSSKQPTTPKPPIDKVKNMNAIVAEAKALGQRIQAVTHTSIERSKRRFQFRKDTAYFDPKNKENRLPGSTSNGFHCLGGALKNPFAWSGNDKNDHSSDDPMEVDDQTPSQPAQGSTITQSWKEVCVPRLLSILQTGAGNALVHDVEWTSRHGRISNLLQELAFQTDNYGPHLIITTQPDVDRWMKEFKSVDSHLRLLSMVGKNSLRALPYRGEKEHRRRLRKRFRDANGLADTSFHVIVTSYTDFLVDYVHFCQTPFEVVLMDDGCSWMAAAGESYSGPTNATLTKVWEEALFSKNDHSVGLAGSIQQEWDYGKDDFNEDALKEVLIGLTARHRVMTSSRLAFSTTEVLPFSRLVQFIAPQFADTVREEWDRSRIGHDLACREHFQRLLARSIVVHDPDDSGQDVYSTSLRALQGNIKASKLSNTTAVPRVITDDHFLSDLKSSRPRLHLLRWLGPFDSSWLRYELGVAQFGPILEAMLASSYCGHVCEENTTVLALSNFGSTGQVTGSLAYKFAVRCGRSFGSEQGLRQHHSTMHALPGTWLCRICGADCVTSQARTHHERSCGQPKVKAADSGPPPAAGTDPKRKIQKGPSSSGAKKGVENALASKEEKDADGARRVLSYRGVWTDSKGKYFIKIHGKKVSTGSSIMIFAIVDDAAKKYDEMMKKLQDEGNVEYNFTPDGSRIVYDEASSSSSTTGFGGNLDNVVPALSVINIRDLPKEVKPLLRDPRQTSRTGGNSKRHVYAYRGVCRQARKGHDRWQSQISFCGRNFYLGTYESEWDAAAIYAWAHLILYGKEATDQAQKEGEEAAVLYEKEMRDIEAGIIPAPAPTLSKKDKQEKVKRKNEEKKVEKEKKARDEQRIKAKEEQNKKQKVAEVKKEPKKRPAKQEKPKKSPAKKPKPSNDEENLNDVLSKITVKAPSLVPHPQFAETSDKDLINETVKRLEAAQRMQYRIGDVPLQAPVSSYLRPCIPGSLSAEHPAGSAILLGLDPSDFDWTYEDLIQQYASQEEQTAIDSLLRKEYSNDGLNSRFVSFIQGPVSVIGCASPSMQRNYAKLGMGSTDRTLGGPIGCIDCNIGGPGKACSETAASIEFRPTKAGQYQLTVLSSTDLITLNGKRVTPELGSFPLFHEDVCTVGARVFVFLLPSDRT